MHLQPPEDKYVKLYRYTPTISNKDLFIGSILSVGKLKAKISNAKFLDITEEKCEMYI